MSSPTASWRSHTIGALRRFTAHAHGPRCALCGARIADEHPHAVSAALDIACVCAPCHLTLRNPSARWLAIDPDRRPHRVSGALPPMPVGLAVATRTADGAVVRYPAPAGMQVVDDDAAWLDVLDLAAAAPLVDSVVAVGGRLVDEPILLRVGTDAAFALQGRAAQVWSGLDGGPAVTDAIRQEVAGWLAEAAS